MHRSDSHSKFVFPKLFAMFFPENVGFSNTFPLPGDYYTPSETGNVQQWQHYRKNILAKQFQWITAKVVHHSSKKFSYSFKIYYLETCIASALCDLYVSRNTQIYWLKCWKVATPVLNCKIGFLVLSSAAANCMYVA